MTRSFFAVVAVGLAGFALAPALLQGCSQTGVGDPCTPEQEYDPQFNGFDPGEVNVESKSFDCQTRLCLANHFQGRVTCPYGQKKNPSGPASPPALRSDGTAYPDSKGQPIGECTLPGSGVPDSKGNVAASFQVTGNPANAATTGNQVLPQCKDRTADKAVYCSCRCANVNGQTNDGAVYCTCPDGFACTPLVTPVSSGDTGLTGSYCIKRNTQYDPVNSCLPGGPHCDPTKADCGTYNGQ